MVFSQTSRQTQNVLKVVEIDRLKPEKNQQVNSLTGVVTESDTGALSAASSPAQSGSNIEEILIPEPLFKPKMFHESDSEFFQDLVQWCSTPAKEELVQTTDLPKLSQQMAHTTDTLHTPISPHEWDGFDANSPTTCGGNFNNIYDPLSPITDSFTHTDNSIVYTTDIAHDKCMQFHEQFLDINNLPVVIEDIASEEILDTGPWQVPESIEWTKTNSTYDTNTHTMPFIDQDDSMDSKLMTSVMPQRVEGIDVIASQILFNEQESLNRPSADLTVDITHPTGWTDNTISTPDVLKYVEQLEKEKCSSSSTVNSWPQEKTEVITAETHSVTSVSPAMEYEPITPKSESQMESEEEPKTFLSKRKRHDSEDSDETYNPYTDKTTTRKYKRKKPTIPLKDMILALEGSQQLPKAKRGRPPKRRESTVSSVGSLDDNSSIHENKYRELRDKNNEASKRSRMNRKLKELQMEQLVVDLEERNKKLKVKADILEDMTTRLKDALMTAIIQK